MNGAGQGHVGLVVAVVGLVTHRGAHRVFGAASAVEIVGTVGLLSSI